MRLIISKRKILLLIGIALLTIVSIGCDPIAPIPIPPGPCTTGTLNIDIADNDTYRVYIDDVLWGTTNWNGDIKLYNVPLGYHNIRVQSTGFPFYCIGNTDTTINCGINNLYIPVVCII